MSDDPRREAVARAIRNRMMGRSSALLELPISAFWLDVAAAGLAALDDQDSHPLYVVVFRHSLYGPFLSREAANDWARVSCDEAEPALWDVKRIYRRSGSGTP